MYKFHIVYKKNPEDFMSSGFTITAISMEEAITSFREQNSGTILVVYLTDYFYPLS